MKLLDDMKNTMTFRQGVQYIFRGFGIIRKLYPGYMPLSAVSSMMTAIQPLIVLYFSARIIDQLAGSRNVSLIILYAGITVGSTFLFRCAGSVVSRRLDTLNTVNRPLLDRYRGERYATMDYDYVEDSSVNEHIADMYAKENASGLGITRLYWFFPGLVQQFFGLIASVVLMIGLFQAGAHIASLFITSSWATALLALSMLLPIILRVLLMKRIARVTLETFANYAKHNTLAFYYFDYVRAENAGKDIRLYGQQPIVSRFTKPETDWITMNRMTSETSGFTSAANAVVSGCTYLIIGLRAIAGMYSIGQVTQYVGAVTAFSGSLTGLISNCAMLWENASYLPVLYEFLDKPSVKRQGKLDVEKRSDNGYDIEFRDVSFKYPGSENYALNNLNLRLNIGKRLAVVGMNGSGKTTMIKLLCRLYDPTDGVITLNGIDIKNYDYDEYMGIFSVVFQDFKLPDLPLGQNVAGAGTYERQQVHDTLRMAGFDESALKNGLDTALNKGFDEDGVVISGGEAQKIALARALYKNAPVIVLDEPTAALDPIAESEIYSKFNGIIGGKTAIYVSHRLSSCRFCDDIAVFHEGKLVQQGNHENLLLNKSGKYYELWNAQAQYYIMNGELLA